MTIDELISNLTAIKEHYGDDLEVIVEDINYKQYQLDSGITIKLGSGENFVALNVKKRIKGKKNENYTNYNRSKKRRSL